MIKRGLRTINLMTEARVKYNTMYGDEEKLNLKFRKFVNNFKTAYDGKSGKM